MVCEHLRAAQCPLRARVRGYLLVLLLVLMILFIAVATVNMVRRDQPEGDHQARFVSHSIRSDVDGVEQMGATALIPGVGRPAFTAVPLATTTAPSGARLWRNLSISGLIAAGLWLVAWAINTRLTRSAQAARAEAEVAKRRLAFLAEASGALASSLDVGSTLETIVRLSVPFLADGCIARLVEADQPAQLAAAAHADPTQEEMIRQWCDCHPARALLPVPQTGQSLLIPDLPAYLGNNHSLGRQSRTLLHQLQVASFMTVPLVARGRPLGFLFFMSSCSGRVYGSADLALAEDLARCAALAVDNAQLYQESQQATRSGEESLALLDTLLASSPVGFALLDPQLRFVRLNAALAKMTGATPEQRAGCTLRELLPQLADQIEPKLQHVLATAEPLVNWELSEETLAAPGQLRHWLVSLYPVRTGSGALLGVGSTVVEITDQKRAEGELQVRVRQQAAVTELGLRALAGADLGTLRAETVALVARTLHVEYCGEFELLTRPNRLLLRTGLGWQEGRVGQATVETSTDSRVTLTSLHQDTVMITDLQTETRFPIPPLLQEHGVVSGMMVVVRGRHQPLGTLGAFTTVRRGFTERDASFLQAMANALGLAVEQARAEAERIQLLAREQAARAEAEEAVRARDQWLSFASHDLQSPLAAIKGLAQLMQRRLSRANNKDAQYFLQGFTSINATATKMANLISEMLDMARLRMGHTLDLHRRPTDLVPLIHQLAAEHRQTTERHRVLVETPVAELVGWWDGVRLERALSNLVSNAIKYSPDGGDVTIQVSGAENEGRVSAVIAVRDQGLGIPAEDLPRIFEPFMRARNVAGRPGTGIGLAGARTIIERHGGAITVQSHEGAGSVFTVRLPLTPYETGGPVLVVDDDALLRQAVQWVLEDEGLSVQSAGDGSQGLALAAQQCPQLVILDLTLPDFPGERIAAELRAAYGTSVPIVIISAAGDVAEQAQRLQAFDYIQKPFEIEHLLETVHRALQRH